MLEEVQPNKLTFTFISTFEMILQGRKYQIGWKSGEIPEFESFPLSFLCFSLFCPIYGETY